MKHIYFIFSLLFLAPISLFAQPIEFAPEGSVWEYQRVAYAWGPPVVDYVEVRYADNIWVDSILCKRLIAPEGDYYVYQEGNRVFHRRDTASQFALLWDFGVLPGDSFVTQSNHYFYEQEIKMVCTGRDTVIENNVALPRIHLTMYCGGTWVQPITINPRYGPMYANYCPSYLFNTYNYCLVDFAYNLTLLQYSYNTFPGVLNCGTSTNGIGTVPAISVSPNPTSGIIQLINLPEEADVYCYDIFGRLVGIPPRSGNTIDLSVYPVGVYVLDIQLDRWVTRKLKVTKI
jgi:hypothetical protein